MAIPPSQSPLVSVLMPVFNGERYLAQSIRSVLEQDYSNFECIIIDDASTDATPVILQGFAGDERVRVIRNEQNLGAYPSLNRAAGLARGTLLAIQDADDLSRPRRLSRQVQAFQNDPQLLLTGCWFDEIDEADRVVRQRRPPAGYPSLYLLLTLFNCLGHSAVMMRREVFQQLGGYDVSRRHVRDFELWYRFSRQGKIQNIPEPLLCWRRHSASATGARGAEQRRNADELFLMKYDALGGCAATRQLCARAVAGERLSFVDSLRALGSLSRMLWRTVQRADTRRLPLTRLKLFGAMLRQLGAAVRRRLPF